MAFMDEIPAIDDDAQKVSETNSDAYLKEDGDEEKVAEENLELGGLVAYIQGRYQRAKDGRRSEETRWLTQYRNFRGLYDPAMAFSEREKSRIFVKVTKTKVLAAYHQVVDVLLAGGKFPIGFESRKYAVGAEDAVNFDPKALTPESVEEKTGTTPDIPRSYIRPDIAKDLGIYEDTLEPVHDELEVGVGATPTAFTWEPAKDAARRMERKVLDQLSSSHASKHLRMVAFESSLFGTGIMKGPFAYDKEYPRWVQEETETGVPGKVKYDPIYETVPRIESRSIWNVYPDPEALIIDDASYVVDRHRLTRSQVRKLKSRPHFRDLSVEMAVEAGPNYVPEYWEHILDDGDDTPGSEMFEVLEFWGTVDAELLEEFELEIPEDMEDYEEFQINAWICNNQILRVVLNPFTPARTPYQAVPFELNPYSLWGIGVAENMEDTQLLMNGFMRLAIDNAALSGNLLIEVDETNLVPGQDLSIYPGKVFRRQAGAPGQAIFGTKFPNVSNEVFMMFDKARQLADESTGIPSYSHGQTGVTGVGRTASGMSMLMGASAQNIKGVVRNFDDYLLVPLGKAMFAFNMQFAFDQEFAKGDLEVVSRGTESLMRNEVRSQRLLQFMQLTANPVMQPFVKYDYVLRELAASMDLDEEKMLNDPREAAIQAKMMAEIAGQMPQPPGQAGPGGPQGPGGPPSPNDPTGNGGGNIAPGGAPEPGAAGFTGGGGGANGGAPAPQPQQAPARGPQ